MSGAMDLRIADYGKSTDSEQAAQIAVTLLADTAQLLLATTRPLPRYQPDPGREVATRSKRLRIRNIGNQSGRQRRPDAG